MKLIAPLVWSTGPLAQDRSRQAAQPRRWVWQRDTAFLRHTRLTADRLAEPPTRSN